MLASLTPSMPLRRTDVLVQHVGDETLLYNEQTHQAFCLNQPIALVWNSCDGTRTPAALAALLYPESDRLTGEAVVNIALARLSKNGLIENYYDADLAGVSRRAMLRQAGAGLALALPVIAMVTAPKAAEAYSGCFDCSNATAAQRLRQQRSVPR